VTTRNTTTTTTTTRTHDLPVTQDSGGPPPIYSILVTPNTSGTLPWYDIVWPAFPLRANHHRATSIALRPDKTPPPGVACLSKGSYLAPELSSIEYRVSTPYLLLYLSPRLRLHHPPHSLAPSVSRPRDYERAFSPWAHPLPLISVQSIT
jgi:hypothetical protein